MSEKSILNKVRVMLGMNVALEQMKLDNGTVVEAEAFEAGQDVMVVTEQGSVPLPMGEYTLESGQILVCTEDGVIAEIKEAAAPATEEAPAPTEEVEAAADPAPVAKKVIESVTKETVFSAEEVEALKAEIESLKTELAAATPSFKHSPEKETAKKEMFAISPNRAKGTQERVFELLNKN
jgi:hypothetical protein